MVNPSDYLFFVFLCNRTRLNKRYTFVSFPRDSLGKTLLFDKTRANVSKESRSVWREKDRGNVYDGFAKLVERYD